jgi:hypothetical protein
MANTYTLIQSVTVGSGGAASIEFGSIPQTYTDLQVLFSLRGDYDTVVANVRFNGLTTNLSSRLLLGSGSAASSQSDASNIKMQGAIGASSFTASVFANSSLYIPNYAGATNKSVSVDYVSENNATTAWMGLTAGLWSNTSAITQITLLSSSGNIVQYSSASLYGIKNS